ncbi:MAG: SCO family protein, partial [Pseudomonadota bacterium]
MTLTRVRVLLLGTAIAVPLLVAAWFILPMFKPQTASAVPIGGPFALVDHTGTPVTDEDFRGRLMMITFGYTFCPDVCPMSLQDMSLAMDELGDDAEDVAFVFVSVDPARDTVEQLASYVELFHPKLVGLTGSEEDIA